MKGGHCICKSIYGSSKWWVHKALFHRRPAHIQQARRRHGQPRAKPQSRRLQWSQIRRKREQLEEGIVKNLKFLGEDGTILTAGKSGKIPPGQTCLSYLKMISIDTWYRLKRIKRYI